MPLSWPWDLALDFVLAMLWADAWGCRSSLPVPHLLTVATVVTSGMKAVVNSVLLPTMAVGCAGRGMWKGGHLGLQLRHGCGEGGHIKLAVIASVVVALVQLQECFAY